MMSQYKVLLFDIDEGGVKAVVPAVPGCEARGTTNASGLNISTSGDFLRRLIIPST